MNARIRIWKPLVDELVKEQAEEQHGLKQKKMRIEAAPAPVMEAHPPSPTTHLASPTTAPRRSSRTVYRRDTALSVNQL